MKVRIVGNIAVMRPGRGGANFCDGVARSNERCKGHALFPLGVESGIHPAKSRKRDMHPHVLVVSAALCVTACGVLFPRTPILPETFEGPLKANADTIVASTQPSYCAPSRHLDFGTTPQGCVRVAGDTWCWVNWTGAGHVVKVGRSWKHPDSLTAFEFFRSMEGELTDKLGRPIECRDVDKWTAREIRWIATEPAGISTALRVSGDPDRPNSARVVLIRALGPERCGYHVDSPWTH
jgi:hypothetical protein